MVLQVFERVIRGKPKEDRRSTNGDLWSDQRAEAVADHEDAFGIDLRTGLQQTHRSDRVLHDPANRVAYAVYFDFDAPDGSHRRTSPGTAFPRSARTYRSLFGGRPAGRRGRLAVRVARAGALVGKVAGRP